ncbi:hypothetical protein ACP70R_035988 [Stipagrostis hirtigluma subsp. patula]
MIFPASAFLDSSSWNTNQLQQAPASYNNNITPSAAGAGGGDGNNLLQHASSAAMVTAGALPEGGGGAANKPMPMSERARLARIPQPEPGLKCPRCDSTNTKFCYFNNYSLTQPRHFCRACRRYWTRGGTLRNVPVGGGYRRHAKRAKPKPAAASSAKPPSSTAACTATTTNVQPMLGSGASPLPPPLQQQYQYGRFSDLDMAFLGGAGGSSAPGMMEQQWRVPSQQVHSFPFLHAMDHHSMGPGMAMPSMFHLGLQSGGEDGGEFHGTTAMKRDQEYSSVRAMNGGLMASYYSGSFAGNL